MTDPSQDPGIDFTRQRVDEMTEEKNTEDIKETPALDEKKNN